MKRQADVRKEICLLWEDAVYPISWFFLHLCSVGRELRHKEQVCSIPLLLNSCWGFYVAEMLSLVGGKQ